MNTIDSTFVSSVGAYVDEFEEKVIQYTGSKYAVATVNGTSALHIALRLAGVEPEDEVITQSLTFIATCNAIRYCNAEPLFLDVDKQTLGLSPDNLNEFLEQYCELRNDGRCWNKLSNHIISACIPMHTFDTPARLEELTLICHKYNIVLIEDAAESFGAKIGDKMTGTFGDAAMLSFCQNKIISTGEGGAIVTDSEDIYQKLKLLVSHGRPDNIDYFTSGQAPDYIALGFNFRLPTMNAALGLSQLQKIEKIIEMRRNNAIFYNSNLSKIDGIHTPASPKDFFHVYQLYTIQVDNGLRDKLKSHLEQKGISSKVYFDPIHLSRFYQDKFGFKVGALPITEKIFKRVLTLPMHPTLTKDEMIEIINEIEQFSEVEK